MLRCADLFSGIGGFTLGLDVFNCTTQCYCDICPVSQAILTRRMADGSLPRAPVHPDVTALHLEPGSIDLLMGGFPCTGFSTMGKRDGIRNQGSGLVSEVYRLMSESQVPVVFLENVPQIARFPEFEDLCRRMDEMSYDVHWIKLKASQFGAPHHRARWFCLGVKRGAVLPEIRLREQHATVPLFDWSVEPPRMLPTLDALPPSYRKRNVTLGNTVVPVCVRAAFLLLWTGARESLTEVLAKRAWTCVPAKACDDGRRGSPYFGAYRGGRLVPLDAHPDILACRPVVSIQRRFMLDPSVYTAPRPRKNTVIVSPPKGTHQLAYLSTPRTICQPAHVLTQRSYRDLSTQLRFEISTRNRHTYPRNEYLEWMQGYPPGWTAYM